MFRFFIVFKKIFNKPSCYLNQLTGPSAHFQSLALVGHALRSLLPRRKFGRLPRASLLQTHQWTSRFQRTSGRKVRLNAQKKWIVFYIYTGFVCRWGDYRKCDTPKITVDNMLKHIADTHPVHPFFFLNVQNFDWTHLQDIDYIIWTGDLPPHDIWNQTREENLKIMKETVKQMSDMFPGAPIFPALGNHESAPVNR